MGLFEEKGFEEFQEEKFWWIEKDLVGLDWAEIGRGILGQSAFLFVYVLFVHTLLESWGVAHDQELMLEQQKNIHDQVKSVWSQKPILSDPRYDMRNYLPQ